MKIKQPQKNYDQEVTIRKMNFPLISVIHNYNNKNNYKIMNNNSKRDVRQV